MLTMYDSVFKTPLNTAHSKNLYSFSREERFQKTRELSCKKSYYDPTVPQTARCASFGYGKRSSLARKSDAPPPGQYESEPSLRNQKGYSFSNTKNISFVDEKAKNLSMNPGPGKYEKTFFGKTYSFSFRSKYEDPLHRHKNKLGPGQYKVTDEINKKGKYSQTKHKSSCCGKIGNEKRFGSDQTVAPGPGKYKDQLGIDPMGNYFNSRIQSKGIRSFAGPNRDKLFLVGENPGPGTYYIFPEFPSTFSSR